MDINQLREKMYAAKEARHAVVAKYQDRKFDLEQELRATLQAEMGEELELARKNAREAELAWKLEDDRLCIEAAKPMYPEGTILHEWTENSRWNAKPGTWIKTGERAVIQIFRTGDNFVGANYKVPLAGAVVIRYLKKDGTPSMRVWQWVGFFETRWCPEGVEPQPQKA
jgi:hypothetical protein